jgi:hypothetical protein
MELIAVCGPYPRAAAQGVVAHECARPWQRAVLDSRNFK